MPSALTGVIERAFFMPLAALDYEFIVPVMMAWLTLKMAANWGRPASSPAPERYVRYRAQQSIKALLSGLISMGFALLGGAVYAGKIPVHVFGCL